MKNKRIFTKIFIVGITIFVCTTMIVACEPQDSLQGSESPSGQENIEGVTSADWSMDMDCETCHTLEKDTMSDTGLLASTHENQGMSCIDCHNEESELIEVHADSLESNTMPTRLSKTDVSRSTCTASGCHIEAALVEATLSTTVLTDKNGLTVNPHDLPEVPDHGEIACVDCHKIHSNNATTEGMAKSTCSSCHHEDVYECNTCH